MTLDTAIKLVRSGGRVCLEHGKLQLEEKRGVLFLAIDGQQTVVAEKVLRDMYWRETWQAK